MSVKTIDLTCQEVVELVDEYLGHALGREERAAFDAHIQTCPPCSTYLAQLKTIVNTAESLGSLSPPVEVEQELMTLFRRWHEKK